MKYIIHKRFKGRALCGDVNLPATTECEQRGNFIFYNDQPLCATTSHSAHQYFATNDDGEGMLRGKIAHTIIKTLSNRDDKYQERWDKVWQDFGCRRFKRTDHEDFWLWNHDFYCADIASLKYIADLIGAKGDW